MSAIAGIYHLDQQEVVPGQISQMVEMLAHRGPDGQGTWCDRSVGLGHRMLRSTPESLLEQLPFVQDNLAITADARIDNRSELIPQLDLGDRSPETITDSEVVLTAYKKWGENCLKELIGDFSFAIWDEGKQQLFCARDHFGVKPFYYYASDSFLVFATEIKAIFCVEGVPRQLNPLRMGDYLLGMFHDTAMTSYQKILRLPPAHQMIVSANGVEISAYWSLDPTRVLPPASDEEYASQLREIFKEAVNCRLRSAYPIGSTLSGGLDSSSIACMAQTLLKQKDRLPLHTFSSVFDSMPECDERRYTKPIFEQGEFISHFVQGDRQTALENIEKMFWHQDEAFFGPNWFMNWPLYTEVKKQGVRIILDGCDGDNAVSEGYGRLSELAEAGQWSELVRQSWKLSKISDLPFWRGLWAYFYHYNLEQTVKRYRLLRGTRKFVYRIVNFIPSGRKNEAPMRWDALLNPEFSEAADMLGRYKAWRKTQGHGGLDERQRHFRNLVTQGTESFALELLDKMIAAFGVEPRYPFWDKRLIEFCLALPADQKLHDGHTRVVMRRAMAGIVPDEVRWRQGKTDFSANLTRSFVENQQALSEAMSSLDFAEEYVDKSTLNEIYYRLLETPSNQDSRQLWLGLSLSLWMRYAFREENKNQDVSSTSSSNTKTVNEVSRERVGSVM